MQNSNSLENRDNSLDLESAYYADGDTDYSGGYYGKAPQGGEKQQLFKFFAILRRHWLMISTIPLLITALTIVYTAQKPDYYKAEVRVQVNNEMNPGAGAGGAGGGSVIVSNPGSDPTYFTTQLQILEGSGLLRRVVKTTDLEHNETFLRPDKGRELTVWQNVKRMFGFYNPPIAADKSDVLTKNKLSLSKEDSSNPDIEAEQLAPYVAYLRRSLNVSPVKDSRTVSKETRLIEVEFTHNDPNVAAKVVNAIADTYVLQNLEQKVQTNAAAGDFLQKRVAELQSLIRSGEERLINYAKSNQILSLDSNQNTVVQRLTDLNGKLGAAENDRIAAEAAYRAALQNPVADMTAQTKDPRTTGLETQLTTLRQRLEELKTEYTDEWTEVIQVRRQIASLEKELQTSGKRASTTQIAALEQTYREAVARERELRNNFQKQRGEVVEQNQAAINYRIIQQEIDTNKTLLDGLLQRSKETDIILNGTPNNVRIVDRALIPRNPAGPERLKNVVIAFAVSLLLGVGLAFLSDWLNDTVSASDDFEAQIGLPVLGVIPEAHSPFVRKLMPANFALTKSGRRRRENVYDLESFNQPIIAESYLQMRTYLLLSTAGGPPQTILVTSGQPGEGKTITAFNLARSLAQTGAKVLIIDADLRYPRLHTINNADNASGLSNLLTVKEINQEIISQIVQKDAANNLDILTAGPHTPNPVNLLGSEQMRHLLKILANEYSHIVIDSPPVLYFADSSILSTFADAVLLIARDKKTSRQSILLAKKRLHEVGAKITGIVLNGVPLSSVKYNNYEYYRRPENPAIEDGQGILRL